MSSNDLMRLKMGRGPLSELDHFTSHRMIKLEHMVGKYTYNNIMITLWKYEHKMED